MAGQFSSLERKSIAPMAIPMEGVNIRGMQHFIGNEVWNEPKMQHLYHGMVAHDIGKPKGALIFDENGFIKKGQESVGAARQYAWQRRQGGKLPGGRLCRLCLGQG